MTNVRVFKGKGTIRANVWMWNVLDVFEEQWRSHCVLSRLIQKDSVADRKIVVEVRISRPISRLLFFFYSSE